MAKIIGVRFRNNGKIYYFDSGRYYIKEGSGVIVETSQGVEYADVVQETREASDSEIVAPLKGILRIATAKDIQQAQLNREKEKEALELATAKIMEHQLDMKLVRVEYTFDGAKIVFYFTSEGRVDFRDLVKDLAASFKTRIELRQIGARDEAKMLGGLGPCGLPCCCNQFLADFQPVSIKMAKEQGLSLNPTKISGLCGRLMCCLKYEQHHYEQAIKLLPKVGTEVRCRDGVGKVCELNLLRERVKVKFVLADDTVDIREYYYKELTPSNAPAVEQPAQELDQEQIPEQKPEQKHEQKPEQKPVFDVLPGESIRRANPVPAEANKVEAAVDGAVKEHKNKNRNKHKHRPRPAGKDGEAKVQSQDANGAKKGKNDNGKKSEKAPEQSRNGEGFKNKQQKQGANTKQSDAQTKSQSDEQGGQGQSRNKKRFHKRRYHKPNGNKPAQPQKDA